MLEQCLEKLSFCFFLINFCFVFYNIITETQNMLNSLLPIYKKKSKKKEKKKTSQNGFLKTFKMKSIFFFKSHTSFSDKTDLLVSPIF